jgi:hypothetical protein
MTFDKWWVEWCKSPEPGDELQPRWVRIADTDPMNRIHEAAQAAWSAGFSAAGKVAVETIERHPLPAVGSSGAKFFDARCQFCAHEEGEHAFPGALGTPCAIVGCRCQKFMKAKMS